MNKNDDRWVNVMYHRPSAYHNKDGDVPEESETLLYRANSCPNLVKFGEQEEHVDQNSVTAQQGSPNHFPHSVQDALKYVDDSLEHAKERVHQALEKVDKYAHKVWDGRWRVVPHFHLPEWQRDNEFLHEWHRPPMPSFRACFGSIFRLHTETGNIWTHLIGFLIFAGICIYFLCLPAAHFVIEWQEKVIFGMFFIGALSCLSFSTLFHTLGCHSEKVYKIFGKLDYSGIALMIMGSFVPWVYYTFYCDTQPKIVYMTSVCLLGIGCIVISQYDKFGTAKYRPVRAALFAALGLSGIVPCIHTIIANGFLRAVIVGQVGWLALMAFLYLFGAFLYANRIPERYFPGKCDLWFQSHQIFHVLVVLAAVVHFHGISNLQYYRYLNGAQCIAIH